MELTTKYHIVPINDGYTYLCLNSNSGYELHEKAEKLPSNLTEILFNNEQTAQRYIDENLLNPQNYKPEAIYINEELYFKRENKMIQVENYYKESENLIYKVKEQIAKLDYDIEEKEFLKSVMEEKYVEVIKDHRTVFDTMFGLFEEGHSAQNREDKESAQKVWLVKDFLEKNLFNNQTIKIEDIVACTDMIAFCGYKIKITIPEIDKNIYQIFIPNKTEITKDNLNYACFGKIAFGVVEPAHTKIRFQAYNPEQVAEYIRDNIINKPITYTSTEVK